MRKTLFAIVALLAALPLTGALASLPERPAIEKAVAFIRTTQQADGGFGGFGDGQTFDAVYAIRSIGLDPNSVQNGGKSPADFLRAKAAAQKKPAEAAKAALAAKALDINPKAVGGVDLIAVIAGGLDQATGRYGVDDFSHSLAILGLACTGNPVPAAAVAALKKTQLKDGGWGFDGASDPDTAAIGLQALLAAGVTTTDSAVAAAIAYFRAAQEKDAGWGFDPEASNASSTAFAVQALIAAGEPVEGPAYTKSGKTPVTFLVSQQLPDGSFAGFDAGFAANQVTPALAGRTFCNASATAFSNQGPIPPATPSPTAPPVPSTPSPTAAATRAPEPPNTGTGAVAAGEQSTLVLVALGAFILSLGAGFGSIRRR